MDQDVLLSAVLANPDDDATRLAYANRLQEAGDPRGELIAVSTTLAALADDDPRRAELARRELALLRALLPAWATALGMAGDVGLARGFPGLLDGHARTFLPIAGAVCARVPLAQLRLRGMTRAWCEQLGSVPVAPALRSLTLWADTDTDADTDGGSHVAAALAGAPWLAQVRELRLEDLGIGDDGFVELATTPRLPALDSLALSQHAPPMKLTRVALTAALGQPAFRRLRTLRLHGFRLKTPGARCFAKATHADQLATLDLTQCGLGADGAQVVLDSTALGSLAQLSLRKNELGLEPAVCVGPALAGTLRRLELSANEIDDAWIRAFVAGPPLALTHLGLHSNLLTITGVRAVLAAPALARLEALTVASQNRLPTPWGTELAAVASMPELARLRSLDAGHTGVTAAGVIALAASPHARGLRRLALRFNKVGAAGARALAHSEHLGELECLELGHAGLDDDAIVELCGSGTLRKLRYLDLAGNAITERGYAALLGTTAFPALRVLRLYGAMDPARRIALEQHLGAMVDVGDFVGAMGRWLPDDELLV